MPGLVGMLLEKVDSFCLARGVLLDNGVHPPCKKLPVGTFWT